MQGGYGRKYLFPSTNRTIIVLKHFFPSLQIYKSSPERGAKLTTFFTPTGVHSLYTVCFNSLFILTLLGTPAQLLVNEAGQV